MGFVEYDGHTFGMLGVRACTLGVHGFCRLSTLGVHACTLGIHGFCRVHWAYIWYARCMWPGCKP